jgi:predicted lipoprotein
MSLRKQPGANAASPAKAPQAKSLFLPFLMGIGAVTAVAAGCERISFYSTGRASSETSSSASSSTGSSTGATGGSTVVTRAVLLDAITTCNVELLDAFRGAAEELDTAAAAAKDDPAAQDKARAAWTKAIDIWQKAEVFQFGPAGPSTTPGGKARRDYIYSWPLVSRCLVEQNLVSKSYEKPDFGTTALVNMRGLASVEYLLFYTGTDNACSPATTINASGQWAALGPAELAARKAHYSSVLASDVARAARDLVKAWSPEGGNFKGQIASAGASGSVYTTEQMALNAVSDAMFYVESQVKDAKLARPLGMLNCDDTTCPEAVESRFAARSRQHIRNNLLGLHMLLAGCNDGEGVGFDDLLSAVGASSLAGRMTADVDAAIAAADALKSDDIAKEIGTDIVAVQNLHAAVKKITDELKTEFVSVLDLELPTALEGDND